MSKFDHFYVYSIHWVDCKKKFKIEAILLYFLALVFLKPAAARCSPGFKTMVEIYTIDKLYMYKKLNYIQIKVKCIKISITLTQSSIGQRWQEDAWHMTQPQHP